jgi:hypothetical protein
VPPSDFRKEKGPPSAALHRSVCILTAGSCHRSPSAVPRAARRTSAPRVITPAQPGWPTVGNFHQIPCKFNWKWAGIRWDRQAKRAGRPPGPLELASPFRAGPALLGPAPRVRSHRRFRHRATESLRGSGVKTKATERWCKATARPSPTRTAAHRATRAFRRGRLLCLRRLADYRPRHAAA